MLDRNNGTISFEKGNLIHVIHVILQILRQLRAFGAHQRLGFKLQQKIVDHYLTICFLFYINYLIILLFS